MRKKMIAGCFTLAFVINACGGGSNLADEAESHAEDTCGCTDFDCTTEHIAWFNEVNITREDEVLELSAADQERFDVANGRAADCQNALR